MIYLPLEGNGSFQCTNVCTSFFKGKGNAKK